MPRNAEKESGITPKEKDTVSISGVLGVMASGEGGHAILGYGGNGGPVRFIAALMCREMWRKRNKKDKSRNANW